jgi:hypothetical protein
LNIHNDFRDRQTCRNYCDAIGSTQVLAASQDRFVPG